MFDYDYGEDLGCETKKTLIMGVYRIYDAQSPERGSFIGFSRNVNGVIKRLRFELEMNICSNRELTAFYRDCLSPTLALYREYTPGDYEIQSDYDLDTDAHLAALALSVKNELGENTRLIQSTSIGTGYTAL